ncbi:hypothetical protein B0J17DRAFT_709851 [Rhizoctonia solani]|nr:hypothetical protein B0J17DRAFT_709851 [Rhizoctonia solani]
MPIHPSNIHHTMPRPSNKRKRQIMSAFKAQEGGKRWRARMKAERAQEEAEEACGSAGMKNQPRGPDGSISNEPPAVQDEMTSEKTTVQENEAPLGSLRARQRRFPWVLGLFVSLHVRGLCHLVSSACEWDALNAGAYTPHKDKNDQGCLGYGSDPTDDTVPRTYGPTSSRFTDTYSARRRQPVQRA